MFTNIFSICRLKGIPAHLSKCNECSGQLLVLGKISAHKLKSLVLIMLDTHNVIRNLKFFLESKRHYWEHFLIHCMSSCIWNLKHSLPFLKGDYRCFCFFGSDPHHSLNCIQEDHLFY